MEAYSFSEKMSKISTLLINICCFKYRPFVSRLICSVSLSMFSNMNETKEYEAGL